MTDIQLAAKSLNEFMEELGWLMDADNTNLKDRVLDLMIKHQPEIAACVIAKGVGE